jgi:N-methylhydantoinase B
LREELRGKRGDDQPLFSRGGTIEELKQRCEAETHLPPPRAPSFAQVAGR